MFIKIFVVSSFVKCRPEFFSLPFVYISHPSHVCYDTSWYNCLFLNLQYRLVDREMFLFFLQGRDFWWNYCRSQIYKPLKKCIIYLHLKYMYNVYSRDEISQNFEDFIFTPKISRIQEHPGASPPGPLMSLRWPPDPLPKNGALLLLQILDPPLVTGITPKVNFGIK